MLRTILLILSLLPFILNLILQRKKDPSNRKGAIGTMLIFITIIGILSVIGSYIKDIQSSCAAQERHLQLINEHEEAKIELAAVRQDNRRLRRLLAPYEDAVALQYPGYLSEDKSICGDLYNFLDPKQLLREVILQMNGRIPEDKDAWKLAMLTTDLIEKRREQSKYPILYFYCQWLIDETPFKSYTGNLILMKITESVHNASETKDSKATNDTIIGVSKLLAFHQCREEWIRLFRSCGLPDDIFVSFDNWHSFGSVYLRQLLDKPVQIDELLVKESKTLSVRYLDSEYRAGTKKLFKIASELRLVRNEGKDYPANAILWMVKMREKGPVSMGGQLLILKSDDL